MKERSQLCLNLVSFLRIDKISGSRSICLRIYSQISNRTLLWWFCSIKTCEPIVAVRYSKYQYLRSQIGKNRTDRLLKSVDTLSTEIETLEIIDQILKSIGKSIKTLDVNTKKAPVQYYWHQNDTLSTYTKTQLNRKFSNHHCFIPNK